MVRPVFEPNNPGRARRAGSSGGSGHLSWAVEPAMKTDPAEKQSSSLWALVTDGWWACGRWGGVGSVEGNGRVRDVSVHSVGVGHGLK